MVINIGELLKDYSVIVSTIIAIVAWFIKDQCKKHDIRKTELYKIINYNHFFKNNVQMDIKSIENMMVSFQKITEFFEMHSSVLTEYNSLIDSMSNGSSIHRQYETMINLELELSKQCHFFNCMRKFKTKHDIEKINTYIPRGVIEDRNNDDWVKKLLIIVYSKVNKIKHIDIENEINKLKSLTPQKKNGIIRKKRKK